MTPRKPLPQAFNFKRIAHPKKKQKGRLPLLPRSILRSIFAKINHPRDQVAFMLSCKRIARRTSRTKLNQRMISIKGDGTCHRVLYAHNELLSALRKWNFVKASLQLCNFCVKYLPRNRVWKTRDGQAIRDLPSVDWMWAISQWQRGVAPCPTCQIEAGNTENEWLQPWPEGYARGALIRQKTPPEG